MVFHTTFNSISAISWWSGLLVEETGESHWQTLWPNVVSRTPRLSRIQTHNLSGDRHRLHRYVHSHCGPTQLINKFYIKHRKMTIVYTSAVQNNLKMKHTRTIPDNFDLMMSGVCRRWRFWCIITHRLMRDDGASHHGRRLYGCL